MNQKLIMEKHLIEKITLYVKENIGKFHQSRIEKLNSLKLETVLKKKNPYLFKAKNIQTAAEIVYSRADRTKEHMGLVTWKNAPDGRILKSDVSVAKNYLEEHQIRQLERTVVGYFDYIEDLIERENTFTMAEFAESVNAFLSFRRYEILHDKGSVSHKDAVAKAETEYDAFNKTQWILSDFDKEVKRLQESGAFYQRQN